MANIKLTYFNGKGRAELSRLLLAASGQKYEDKRVTSEEWQTLKPKTRFGCMPVIEYKGKTYGQSMAIAQLLARELGFYGKNNEEAARIDEVVGVLSDVKANQIKAAFEKDETKKAEQQAKNKENNPVQLKYLEEMAVANGKNGFLVGSKLSLADVMLYDLYDTFGVKNNVPELESGNAFPELKKVMRSVDSNPGIKDWLAKRPQTTF